jgi:hypothetical protein
MPHPDTPGDLCFELFDQRAVVREPAAIEHLVDARHQPLPIGNVRTPHVQLPRKAAEPLKDGEVFHLGLHGSRASGPSG